MRKNIFGGSGVVDLSKLAIEDIIITLKKQNEKLDFLQHRFIETYELRNEFIDQSKRIFNKNYVNKHLEELQNIDNLINIKFSENITINSNIYKKLKILIESNETTLPLDYNYKIEFNPYLNENISLSINKIYESLQESLKKLTLIIKDNNHNLIESQLIKETNSIIDIKKI